jgi:hypothetical protein
VTHKKYKKVFRNVNCSLPVSEWLPSDNIQYAPKQYTAHPNYKSNVFDLYLPTNSPDRKAFDRNVHLFQLKFATENCAWITSVYEYYLSLPRYDSCGQSLRWGEVTLFSSVASEPVNDNLIGSVSRILSSSLSWRSLNELFVSVLQVKYMVRY